MRTLLQLSYVHRELGDLYLASVLGNECLAIATQEKDGEAQAGVLNSLGNIRHEEGDLQAACNDYRRALVMLDDLGGVLTNLGGCLAEMGSYAEGVSLIHEAHACAVERGYRRVAALSMTRLGEAQLARGERDAARVSFGESDTLASRAGEAYHDILFLNAYRRWEMARQEGNDTREKIAFGRLRHLRSLLERRFPEVVDFDRYVERVRRKHVLPS
jgi:Tfp pilus assembly protein PilF